MSTSTLQCHQCHTEFQKRKAEVTYLLKKNPNHKWFCGKECSSIYKNLHREQWANNKSPGPQYGNKYGKKWDGELSFYIHRVTTDSRQQKRLTEDRQSFHDHIKDLWTGRCTISNHPITRRYRDGSVDQDNPFFIASLDRIDNSKPYQIGNVQWVSVAINHARNNHNLNDFKQYWQEAIG